VFDCVYNHNKNIYGLLLAVSAVHADRKKCKYKQ